MKDPQFSYTTPNMAPATKELVFTDKAPKPLPQFSQAVKYNGMVYCSGNIGMDPKTWTLVEGTITDRTVRCAARLTCPNQNNTR